MVRFALGFVIGAWCLQQQARLPQLESLAGVGLLSISAWAFACGLQTNLAPKRLIFRSFIKSLARFLLAVYIGFCWAALCAQMRLSDELPHAWEQKSITLVGVVASVPEITERGERFNFNVEKVLTFQTSPIKPMVPQHISLNLYENFSEAINHEQIAMNHFHVGERWQLTVRLKRPHTSYNPHGFDFEAWALSENIRATGTIRLKSGIKKLEDFVWQPRNIVNHFRERIGQRINEVLVNKPYSGVIRALVIGDDSQIAREDWEVYLNTGTNHLMSISGLHITMLSGLAFVLTSMVWRQLPKLIEWLPTRKAATLAGMFVAIIYASLAGYSVPTQRTLYMLMTVALMLLLGRKISTPRILSIALLVVALLDPWAMHAPGFWLSFGAIAVIAYITSARLASAHWLIEAARTQWAITLGLLPALVLMFGQFSLVSPIANAFAIPLISFAVVPPAILGSIFPIDSALIVAQKILQYSMLGLQWLSDLPSAIWQQQIPPVWTVLLAALGMIVALLPKGIPLRWLGLVCLLPMLLVKTQAQAMGEMKVTVLDVGQGLSVVIQTAKHSLVYDAGSRFTSQSDAGSRVVVPYLRGEGITKLNGVLVSHDDIDHSGGISSVLAAMPTNWLISSLNQDAELFLNHAFQANMPKRVLKCVAGQYWQWDQVKFEMIYPTKLQYQDAEIKDNNKSCVLKVTSQYGSLLIPGDAEHLAELEMLEHAGVLKSDILIAPHHGSKTSSSPDFIDAVSPRFVIVTNGYLNRFGHPKSAIEQRYQQFDAQVFRSDYHGAIQIVFKSDESIGITSWRKAYPKYWHDQYLQ